MSGCLRVASSLVLGLSALAPLGASAGSWAHVHVGWGPRIGVRVQPMTPELREYFEVEGEGGVLVAQVEKESPAEEAGIRVGDVLVEADGKALRSPAHLVRAVRRAAAGGTMKIALVREGKREEIDVQPREDSREWHGGFHGPRLPPETFGPGLPPEHIGPDLGGALRRMREQLRDLERRLDDLERDLEQRLREPDQT